MKILLSSSVLAASVLLSSIAQAEFSGSVGAVSDYRFRGISQSGEEVAVQGGIEYFHESGAYAGWWGSSVDYYAAGDAWDNNESVEHDLYVGYFGEAGTDLTYDLTYYQYFYPGTSASVGYNEVVLGVDYKSLRVAYSYADDYFNLGENYSYIEANYKVSLPSDFTIALHTGYSFGDVLDPNVLGLEEYIDYSVALEKSAAGLDLSIAYSGTDIEDSFKIEDGLNANQGGFVLSVSKSF